MVATVVVVLTLAVLGGATWYGLQDTGDAPVLADGDAATEQPTDDTDDTDDADDAATEQPTDDVTPSGRLPDHIRASGTVTLGVANEVPFGFVDDDGEPTGIAPDVARAVLASLGIDDVRVEVVAFGELIGGLQAGEFDILTAGMYITPERAEQIFFSDPDYCIAASLAVPAGNPDGLVDYRSIAADPDLTVAIATATVELDYARDAGVSDGQIALFDDIASMYRVLEAGEVDAVTGTAARVRTEADARDGIDAVEPFLPTDRDGNDVLPCGGHGFADEDLRDAYNEVLNRFREDGTTMAIITSYEDFSEADVELANRLRLEDFLTGR